MRTSACKICESTIDPFLSFGQMPIANGFLTPSEFADEYFFELAVGFCPHCSMVQLTEHVDRDRMFHGNYAFYSSTSVGMANHFQTFARGIIDRYLNADDPFVVEIGSNDGIMLRHFAEAGVRHVGIEPSANVAEVASSKGVNTITRFFDEHLARDLITDHGKVDAFLGANVMCHLPYLHSVAEGIRILLKPDGVLVFEDPYLGDIVEKTSYDQIYDEHAFYFSATSVNHLFTQHGMEVVDCIPQDVHGGSMRYVVAHRGARDVSDSAVEQLEKEDALGLHRPETFERLRKDVHRSKEQLVALLDGAREGGQRVVGYGATSKSTTVTNFCGITPDLVEYISDTTPIKQGKFSPGAHIPVRPYEEFVSQYPDLALLFAWNHSQEIMAKEQDFKLVGGKWLTYVPTVGILS